MIDDEMCGAILRSVRGVTLDDSSIDLDMIEYVATGPGHYLGEMQTLALMKTEFVYPGSAIVRPYRTGPTPEAARSGTWPRTALPK